MKEFNKLQAQIIRRALILLSFCAGPLFLMGELKIVFGLCLGTAVSILNFISLARDVRHITNINPEKAKSYFRSRAIGRYALAGASLFIAQNLEQVDFFGTCIGLFIIKLAIFSNLGVREWKRCFNQ
ncbi:MAG: ATP synthase subunit I [bacterium]|nr:ATP synthase subunit I [bacterium]